ncbi:TolC family protein [Gramella sp. GC03-9]|uniref:TolC family protein n=1 Tax=Christiangramia oceanisediminis TaxID=2920386 RepID=A0A9X2RDD3_9FLAO|nr:TolC family protein [Gramella oceanisediminis]MCP9201265.1 TolC family protein [Gramella oceanisediminis]
MKKFIILFLFITTSLTAQNSTNSELSLEECIQIAIDNNIAYQRSELQFESEELNFKGTRSQVLPSINGGYSYAMNKGRSIDPYTNDVIDQQFSFSNASLRLNARLFNGFELRNSIRRDRFKMKAAEAEKEAAKQQLILDVTLAYFQVLNSEDLLQLTNIRLQATENQMNRIAHLAEEGSGNPADFTDIQGQFSNDQSAVVAAENQLKQAKLDLAQLLNTRLEIEVKEFQVLPEIKPYQLSAEEVYEESLENLEVFEGQRLRLQAAEEDVSVARSLFAPEISLFAQMNTNYSSLASLLNETGSQVVETGQFININGVSYAVQVNQTQFSQQEIPYFNQLNNNLSSVAGISVNIPILNGFQAKREVSLKKIGQEDARLALENTRNEYFQAIKQAHNDMKAAYKDYFFLKDQVTAYQESYRVNEIRFQNGVSNMVEYIISKNNLDRARVNLANAKYEFLIRTKILDYYRGII